MKIRMMLAVGLMLSITGLIMAAEAEESSTEGRPARMQAPTRAVRPTETPNLEERFNEQRASQANAHQQAINELAAIKKLAEGENATKTAAAIQAMIDKKNEEFKKTTEQLDRQRQERVQQLQQRMRERPQPRGAAERPAGEAGPQTQQ